MAKFTQFAEEAAARERIGARYTCLIETRLELEADAASSSFDSPSSTIQMLRVGPDRTSVYGQYTVLVPDRDKAQKHLASVGIPTAIHYPIPLNEQPAYKASGLSSGTPILRWLAQYDMSLPMGTYLRLEDQDRVVEALRDGVLG